jgi:hypothetical protein
MTNQDPHIQREKLKRLFDEATLTGSQWITSDLAMMLKHQLDAPLEDDLVEVDPRMEATLSEAATICDVPVRTFGDALLASRPRAAFLEMIKNFAKALRDDTNSVMPKEIATMMYYCAIAAGIANGIRITSLSDEKIRKGFAWSLSQSWLTSELRVVFERAVAVLG